MPQHHPDERQPVEGSRAPAAGIAPVPQHGDPVRDRIDLIEEMRDEDDRESPVFQVADDAKQPRDLARIKARGRLVEDQDLARQGDRARNGDDLLDRDGIGGKRPGHVDRQPIGGQQVACRMRLHAAPDHAAAHRLAAQHQVLGHGQVRQQVHLLVNRPDPQPLRVGRGARVDRRAVERHGAAVAAIGAGQALDKRGLARPVLAQKRMHLAPFQVEIHAVERPRAGEQLGEAARLKQSGHCRVPFAPSALVPERPAKAAPVPAMLSSQGPSCCRRPPADRPPACTASIPSG